MVLLRGAQLPNNQFPAEQTIKKQLDAWRVRTQHSKSHGVISDFPKTVTGKQEAGTEKKVRIDWPNLWHLLK